jgi:hypothetical protein
MKTTKAQTRRNEDRVTRLYGQACHGVQVSVFDLGKIMKVGLEGIAAELDDETIKTKISEFVQTIRQN